MRCGVKYKQFSLKFRITHSHRFPTVKKITQEFQKQMEVRNQQLHLIAHSPQTSKYLFTKTLKNAFAICITNVYLSLCISLFYLSPLSILSCYITCHYLSSSSSSPNFDALTHSHRVYTEHAHKPIERGFIDLFQNDPTKCCRHNP